MFSFMVRATRNLRKKPVSAWAGEEDWGWKLLILTIEDIHLSKCGQACGTYFGYSVIFEKMVSFKSFATDRPIIFIKKWHKWTINCW